MSRKKSNSSSSTINYFSRKEKEITKKKLFRNEAAIKQLKLLLDNDPKNVDNRFRLGKLYFDQGGNQEAIQELLGVLDIEPRHFKSLSLLGAISYRLGDKKQAGWF